jgi:hypothetical protein
MFSMKIVLSGKYESLLVGMMWDSDKVCHTLPVSGEV